MNLQTTYQKLWIDRWLRKRRYPQTIYKKSELLKFHITHKEDGTTFDTINPLTVNPIMEKLCFCDIEIRN